MKWQLSIPSKTFLVGEYAVLKSGPALVLNTTHRFHLLLHKAKPAAIEGIQPSSPAGQWLAKHPQQIASYQIKFLDPYAGLGGFGASTAQYALLKTFFEPEEDRVRLLTDYRAYAWDRNGILPSGVDLISQINGGLCYYQPHDDQLDILDWPFTKYAFILAHTGYKLATHQHLQTEIHFSATELTACVKDAYESLRQRDIVKLCAAINYYADLLQGFNLVAPYTIQRLNYLRALPEVLAAKGCGAMGADVLLIITHTHQQTPILSWLAKQGLKVIYAGQQVQQGMKVEEIA